MNLATRKERRLLYLASVVSVVSVVVWPFSVVVVVVVVLPFSSVVLVVVLQDVLQPKAPSERAQTSPAARIFCEVLSIMVSLHDRNNKTVEKDSVIV